MKQNVIGYGSREWKWSAELDKLHRARVGYLPSKWRESLRGVVDEPVKIIEGDGKWMLDATEDRLANVEYRERCVEEWKRRNPDIAVLDAHAVSDDRVELDIVYVTPGLPKRIDATFTVLRDEPGNVHSDPASG